MKNKGLKRPAQLGLALREDLPSTVLDVEAEQRLRELFVELLIGAACRAMTDKEKADESQ